MPSSFSPDPTAPLTAARETVAATWANSERDGAWDDLDGLTRHAYLLSADAVLAVMDAKQQRQTRELREEVEIRGKEIARLRGVAGARSGASVVPPADLYERLEKLDEDNARLRARVAEADDLRTAFEIERRQWRATTDTVVRRESDRADNAIGREEVMEEYAREVEQERDQLRAELAETRSRLSAVLDLCDREERNAMRWEHSIPVPEWVAPIQRAALGDDKRHPQGGAPNDATDNRRRIYLDGKGDAWISVCAEEGVEYVVHAVPAAEVEQAIDEVREATGGLREIGRCW